MKLGTSLILATGAIGVLASTSAQAQTDLKLNHYMFVKHFFVQKVVKPWGQDIERLTDGRVKLSIPVKSLSPTPRQWASVEQGVAGVAISHDGFQRKRLRLMSVAYLPMTTTTSEKAGRGLWKTYDKYFRPANEYKGVKFIGAWTHAGSYLFTSKKQIKSAADIKGMKIRVTPGTGVDTFKAMGANVVTSAGPQVFELVSKRIVDGVVFPADGIKRFKIDKYLKHVSYVRGSFYNQSWSLIMNKEKWDGLSKADQKAIDSVSGERVGATAGAIFDDLSGKALKSLVAGGIQRTDASPAFVAELTKVRETLEADWLAAVQKKGVDGKAALAYFQSQL